jgi:DNA-binding beta-propeller fold protein YncE
MRQLRVGFVAIGILACAAVSRANDRGPLLFGGAVEEFAVLPDGVRFPEGITANPANGDIFVGTFDSGPNANKLLRFSRGGRLLAQKDFGGTPLLGLGFDATGSKVYVLNVGASKVQRIAAAFDSSTTVEDVAKIPSIGPPAPRTVPNPDSSSDLITFGSSGFAVPNAMVFDHSGNLYVSDSFQGAIFRIANVRTCAAPCTVTTVSHDPLLPTAGFPPFGANGLALDSSDTTLYIANTGDNRVLRMNVSTAAVSVFAESIHGADGLLFDGNGRLWVAANQADEVVALNDKGRVVARVGSFDGIRHDGTPRGLLFPASMVIVDDFMYVTNLALPLTSAVGDEPEEDVTRWNVARFRVPRR